jgi:uncharacterized DUF497 family protein
MYFMASLSFEWDNSKSLLNKRKHGVSFEEARSVFYDDDAVEFYDDEHSEWENRFLMLGMSSKLRILLVCYCERAQGDVIRIISARKATPTERIHYTEKHDES